MEIYIPIVIVLCVFSVFTAYTVALIQSQFRQVIESAKTEMYRLPDTVRRNNPPPLIGTVHIPILMYHYVEYVRDHGDTIRQSLNIIPRVFEEQVKTLSDAGYTFLTASELADILDGKTTVPRKPVLLTFDDGHWDLYTDILPILEKYHVRATAYIISGFIGGGDFMTDEQLRRIIQSGLFEIGAHTVHHVALYGKMQPVLQYEIGKSKEELEQRYHLSVVSFAYPAGSFDDQAMDMVRKVGFRTAMSTVPGVEQSKSNRFFLFRIRPGYRVGNELLNYLEQEQFKPW